MKKCSICGREATIYAGGKWWCKHHYQLLKQKSEEIQGSEKDHIKTISKIDLGLARV